MKFVYDEWNYTMARTMADRKKICVWLRANGISPDDVPLDALVTVENGDQIVCPIYRRNAEGKLFRDDATGQPARSTITVSLLAEPGESVGRWLLENAARRAA